MGLTLAWAQVLMLPLDVANMTGFGGGIDMKLFWFIVYITTAIMCLVIIPSLIFYYECDENWSFVIVNLYLNIIVGKIQIFVLLFNRDYNYSDRNFSDFLCIHWNCNKKFNILI